MARHETASDRDARRVRQREALWKWRWLGLKESTPAFKGALAIAGAAALWIAIVYVTG